MIDDTALAEIGKSISREEYAADTKRAAFFWERHDGGVVTKSEWINDVQQKIAGIGDAPYTFVAIPFRRDLGEAPTIPVREGMVPIWGHRVIHTIEAYVKSILTFEALIFGAGVPLAAPDALQKIRIEAKIARKHREALCGNCLQGCACPGYEGDVEREVCGVPHPTRPGEMLYDIVGDVMLVIPEHLGGGRFGFRSYLEAQAAFSL